VTGGAREFQHGRWRVWLAAGTAREAEAWTETVARLVAVAAPLHRSKHAATYSWTLPGGSVFVKVYHRYRPVTVLKDLVRTSKARHNQRISARLAAAGFAVPRVLAVGEERRGPVVRRTWLATEGLAGGPVADHVARRSGALPAKRATLAAVGEAVAKLHATGFVAGDLVATNIWITPGAGGERVTFLDHDRTTRGRGEASWRRARRNLVQLNRLALAGVTRADRLRVYRAYAEKRGWPWQAARRHLAWIIAKTAEKHRRIAARSRARSRAGGRR
jgi:tRNA A-37 threonylcarbamoyl transferase component Bud32